MFRITALKAAHSEDHAKLRMALLQDSGEISQMLAELGENIAFVLQKLQTVRPASCL